MRPGLNFFPKTTHIAVNKTSMEKAESHRIESIDLLRGLVMMFMLLDHSRDYFHFDSISLENNPLDPNESNAALYLTRWITHLCAPVFVSLAGLSIYIQKQNLPPGKPFQLTKFLISRGLWLILLEITVISIGWSFLAPFQMSYFQVIWAIGISMVFMGFLVLLPNRLVLFSGICVICFHNLLDPFNQNLQESLGPIWKLIHSGGFFAITETWKAFVVYPFLPWLGIMMVGFGAGSLFQPGFDPLRRRKVLLFCGLSFLTLFLLFRWINLFGDPDPIESISGTREYWYHFFDVEKYPPSLLYTLATLGIGCLVLRQLETLKSPFNKVMLVFGKVPLFFYILHLYAIHLLAILVFLVFHGDWKDLDFQNNFGGLPVGSGYSLIWVYAFSAFLIFCLYWPCRWFVNVKRNHKGAWWVSYI
jgi:uncharacterized membrane protein